MSNSNGASAKVKQISDDAKEAARNAYSQAEQARKDAVKQMFETADEIRVKAREFTGDARDNANTIARNLERRANDLNSRSVDRAEEVTEVAQNNVWKSLLAIFFVGLIVGWWLGND